MFIEQRTRIIATIGPSSNSLNTLVDLINSGMNVARLNFSHGTLEDHRNSVKNIREATKITGKEVAIIQDLPGPKIRLGKVRDGAAFLQAHDAVDLVYADFDSSNSKISIPSFDLSKVVKEGDSIYLADGAVKLHVLAIDKKDKSVHCLIKEGGIIRPNQGVNLPGGFNSSNFLNKKDQESLSFGEEIGVDYVALSFVQHVADIEKARKLTTKPIIIKIEKPLAIKNLEKLIVATDGVMIARGDLGVEMSLPQVPVLQKEIIKVAGKHSKIIITATQMLESMITSVNPTRAEVTDVANAILDGTDGVMLSAETAIGDNPVEVVKVMNEVALATEPIIPHEDWLYRRVDPTGDTYKSLARAAVFTAEQSGIKCFLVPTETGYSAQILSSFRPSLPVHAFTFNKETERRCQLYWGVKTHPIKKQNSLDDWIKECIKEAERLGLVEKGDQVGILTTNHINHLLNIKTV